MKVKLLEIVRKHRVDPEWRKWQDVPASRRGKQIPLARQPRVAGWHLCVCGSLTLLPDGLRYLCPHLFILRTPMAQSLDAEIVPAAHLPSTARASTKAPNTSLKRSSSKRPRRPLAEARTSTDVAPDSARDRSRSPARPSETGPRSVCDSSQKRKHDSTPVVIVISDDSDSDTEPRPAKIDNKQWHAPVLQSSRGSKDATEEKTKRRKKKRLGVDAVP